MFLIKLKWKSMLDECFCLLSSMLPTGGVLDLEAIHILRFRIAFLYSRKSKWILVWILFLFIDIFLYVVTPDYVSMFPLLPNQFI